MENTAESKWWKQKRNKKWKQSDRKRQKKTETRQTYLIDKLPWRVPSDSQWVYACVCVIRVCVCVYVSLPVCACVWVFKLHSSRAQFMNLSASILYLICVLNPKHFAFPLGRRINPPLYKGRPHPPLPYPQHTHRHRHILAAGYSHHGKL